MAEQLNSGTGGGGSGDSGGDGGGGGLPTLESRVKGIVASWLVGGILVFRDRVTGLMLDAQDAFLGALRSGGEPVAEAIAFVAGVPLDLVEMLSTQLSAIASAAGPLAPLVVIVAWALAAIITLSLLRFLWWVIPLVIPWL